MRLNFLMKLITTFYAFAGSKCNVMPNKNNETVYIELSAMCLWEEVFFSCLTFMILVRSSRLQPTRAQFSWSFSSLFSICLFVATHFYNLGRNQVSLYAHSYSQNFNVLPYICVMDHDGTFISQQVCVL